MSSAFSDKIFNYKGVIVVFLWSFLILNMLTFLLYDGVSNQIKYVLSINSSNIFGMTLILYPVFGWIADVYWGRYKMIRRSLWMMWLSTMAFSLISTMPHNIPHIHQIRDIFNIILFVLMSLSLGGLQANILQFGIDQLPDASSDDLVAFSDWYVWVCCVSTIVTLYSQNCICLQYDALAKLLLPVFLTLALCLDFLLNHWLIKEPTSENPFKLIYKVLRFALKNKHPRLRSAFTYWDDKRYSRIDLAMKKFGGPFTVEEVEDVKTFGRIILILFISTIFAGVFSNLGTVALRMISHLRDVSFQKESKTHCSSEFICNCFLKVTVNSAGYLVMTVLIPVYKLVLHRLVGRLSILTKFNIGFFLGSLTVIGDLCIEVIGHIKLSVNATNITCLLVSSEINYSPSNSLPLDYKWLMIPNTIYGISVYLMLSSVLQFICAQSPYSMKGLILGLMYGFVGLSYGIVYLVLLPVERSAHKWSSGKYGCGVWYLLAGSIALLLIFVIISILSWRYKRRRRDDLLPSEHVFAINYYDRYTALNSTVES